jgi:hypothetical protein
MEPSLRHALWHVCWSVAAATPAAPAAPTASMAVGELRRWLIFAAGLGSRADDSEDAALCAELQRLLAEQGDNVSVMGGAAGEAGEAAGAFTTAACQARLQAMRPHGVVFLAPLQPAAEPSSPVAVCHTLRAAFGACQAVALEGVACALFVLTRGAHAIERADPPCRPDHAPLCGWARALARELPQATLRLVDLCPHAPPRHAAMQALQQLRRSTGAEGEVAVRAHRTLLPSLAPWRTQSEDAARGAGAGIDATRTYVLTGALGGAGLHVLRGLLQRGARHCVLVTRSQRTVESRAAEVAALRAEYPGSRLEVRMADVEDACAVRALLVEVQQRWPPCDGILHLAGALDDGNLRHLDWARCARVLGAKVDGALHLHAISLELAFPLRHFVLFSSVYALLGYAQLTHPSS